MYIFSFFVLHDRYGIWKLNSIVYTFLKFFYVYILLKILTKLTYSAII